ncbi:iron ABC transporter substrate-binding protein [Youhaiella tibetensis]|uniref:Iron ABC transporter substrate-binding protein n=1 Tax=Paradevosia tibetensis TaxID=1447062 RepID=A0A5B9DMQ7_9HYPH|nr:iron ABC transporter substrate-binding protein [Youhaiella tibetensis]QEE20009.1 iron ABC transporter substrate-binding protein [Youhaiella tibetensis]GGF27897.1 iron ABC transporter substrate-binding protein [Youhaiella tibetensis]
MKFSFAGAAALAILTLSAAAVPARAQEGITVYNAQHEALTQAWADAFTKDTGIPVTMRQGGDLEIGNQIVQEGANSPADVFLTENSPAMVLVDNAGLLEPLPQDILDQVPEQFRPANGHWTGIAARSTVFAYDQTRLDETDLPKSIMDLADPAWKGRWAASPAGADFQAIVAAMLALEGEEATSAWLKAMKENAHAYRGNRAAMAGVNNGEVEGAVIYHYYWFGDQANTKESSGNVALHYFKNQDPGAFVSTSGGAVLASSKHKDEAEQFIKWVTGPKGQAILRDGTSFEYAVGVGAQSNPALVPLAELDAPKIDASTLDNAKVTELMTAAGLL